MRLHAFTCGWLTGPTGLFLDGEHGTIRMPVPAFLIEHPKGNVLFDTACTPTSGTIRRAGSASSPTCSARRSPRTTTSPPASPSAASRPTGWRTSCCRTCTSTTRAGFRACRTRASWCSAATGKLASTPTSPAR